VFDEIHAGDNVTVLIGAANLDLNTGLVQMPPIVGLQERVGKFGIRHTITLSHLVLDTAEVSMLSEGWLENV
jgi:hypothetical protein